jgi:hypothetical protein
MSSPTVNFTIAAARLENQQLTRTRLASAVDVVAWFGAVQAQEYPAARWGVGQRMREGVTDADIRRAVDSGRILRTHVMRPTWHFVARDDIRWMLELTAPRVNRFMAHYYRRKELDAPLRTRAAAIVERALGDGVHLTRNELGAHLARAGVIAKGVRLAMLTLYAELEGLMCSGAYREKQLTYALLAQRAPRAKRLSRDEALATLTRRFFASHGPATVRDFVWWSGLTTPDAKRGLDMNGARPDVVNGLTYWSIGRRSTRAVRSKRVHLLPVYDEYLVAYRDRDAVPHGVALNPAGLGGPRPFLNPLVINSDVAGTWKPERQRDGFLVEVRARKLTAVERRALAQTVARYERFLESPVTLRFT